MILYYTILYYTILYYTILYYTIDKTVSFTFSPFAACFMFGTTDTINIITSLENFNELFLVTETR